MQNDTASLLPSMMEARDHFMELVNDLRPELHRYCARMTGSVFDGEDVVQDTLAKAYYALGQMYEPPNLRPWLFRIAHNTAMDYLRRRERSDVDLVAEVPERAEPQEQSVDPALVEAALSVFIELPPVQRSAVVLKDVLGNSLEEIATATGTTVGAVKAALSRARANIARSLHASVAAPAQCLAKEDRATLQRFVDLFNDRNWAGLRALLVEETQLDVVSRVQGRALRGGYATRYATYMESEALRAELGFVDGVAAVAIFQRPSDDAPAYFILLEPHEGHIASIRDFRYIPYIARDARYTPA